MKNEIKMSNYIKIDSYFTNWESISLIGSRFMPFEDTTGRGGRMLLTV